MNFLMFAVGKLGSMEHTNDLRLLIQPLKQGSFALTAWRFMVFQTFLS